ncbi:hypothetical protein MRX96_050694 [Rhipicephalus microplus]
MEQYCKLLDDDSHVDVPDADAERGSCRLRLALTSHGVLSSLATSGQSDDAKRQAVIRVLEALLLFCRRRLISIYQRLAKAHMVRNYSLKCSHTFCRVKPVQPQKAQPLSQAVTSPVRPRLR